MIKRNFITGIQILGYLTILHLANAANPDEIEEKHRQKVYKEGFEAAASGEWKRAAK